MNKLLTTTAVFITLTTSAMADPLTDFFSGIFGGQSHQQTNIKRGKYVKSSNSHHTDDSSSDWFGHSSGGSRMVASFYGHGERLSRHTASGAVFNPHAFTAAHRHWNFGSRVKVCHQGCVVVIINDRGPFIRGRELDLSYGAARAIGLKSTGTVYVERQ